MWNIHNFNIPQMKLKRKLAIYLAKITNYIIRKLNRGDGAVLPGYVARVIDPDILSALSSMVCEKIIVTTGTNGKTTTNSLLSHVLKAEGKIVLTNRTGANMLNGIVSAFVLATNKRGRLNADYACIEVDEMEAVHVLTHLNPHVIILTNIFRDQLDRCGEVDILTDKLKNAFSSVPRAQLVVNCDDVLSYSLALSCPNPVKTYGIDQQVFDIVSRSEIKESIFCRFCGKKLEFDFFHYGQLGSYHCTCCSFKRPAPDHTANNISFYNETYTFSLDCSSPEAIDPAPLKIYTKARSPYNIYNTLSAFAALRLINLPKSSFKIAVEGFDYGNMREKIFTINGACVQLHLAKNPIGFQQKISLILKDTAPKNLIIQINDTAQDGKDISWLWDVDFRYLKDAGISNIIISGTRRYDMELRLKYEDILCRSTPNMYDAIQMLTAKETKPLYIVVNYSGLNQTNRLLAELQDQKGGVLT